MGEKLALRHLEGKGYRLITRNYFIRGGEIDLILKIDGILVFVEVKTRRSRRFGFAAEALTMTKKQKLLRAINTYRSRLPGYIPWRADLIAIDFTSENRANISHYQNIFET
jgi:putative endonuclease